MGTQVRYHSKLYFAETSSCFINLQIFCIFLFLAGSSLFGTLLSQVLVSIWHRNSEFFWLNVYKTILEYIRFLNKLYVLILTQAAALQLSEIMHTVTRQSRCLPILSQVNDILYMPSSFLADSRIDFVKLSQNFSKNPKSIIYLGCINTCTLL